MSSDTDATASGAKPGTPERVAQQLMLMLMTGRLVPGEQIRQQETAEYAGVSRIPLREALNILARQGVLVHKPNQGFFVAKRTPAEVAQLRRMLHLLENEVLGSLNWPEPGELERLRQLNERMHALTHAQDWSEVPLLNREFHNTILQLSPHHLIVREIMHLYMLIDPLFGPKFEQAAERAKRVQEHEAIIQALELRNRTTLMSVIADHRYPEGVGFAPEGERAE